MIMYDLVGIGSMVVDHIKKVERIVPAESKGNIIGEEKFLGGVVVNHLAWSALFGLKVGCFGRGAGDADGDWMREAMQKLNIDASPIRAEGSATSYADIFVDPNGERAIYMSRGATAETTAEHVHLYWTMLISQAKFVSTEISQLPLDAVIAVLEIAQQSQVPTFLDIDIPPQQAVEESRLGSWEQLEKALHLATYLKPTKEVAISLIGEKPPLQLAQGLFERYKKQQGFVAITDGSQGAVLYDGEQEVQAMAYPNIKSVDSTGAGDAFLGGLIAGVHKGLSLQAIGQLACACGAVCCQNFGAVPTVNALQQITELFTESL